MEEEGCTAKGRDCGCAKGAELHLPEGHARLPAHLSPPVAFIKDRSSSPDACTSITVKNIPYPLMCEEPYDRGAGAQRVISWGD